MQKTDSKCFAKQIHADAPPDLAYDVPQSSGPVLPISYNEEDSVHLNQALTLWRKQRHIHWLLGFTSGVTMRISYMVKLYTGSSFVASLAGVYGVFAAVFWYWPCAGPIEQQVQHMRIFWDSHRPIALPTAVFSLLQGAMIIIFELVHCWDSNVGCQLWGIRGDTSGKQMVLGARFFVHAAVTLQLRGIPVLCRKFCSRKLSRLAAQCQLL